MTTASDRSPNPLDRHLGLRITEVDADRVDAELDVHEEHKQAHGIVHGGLYCTIIESVASIGANAQVAGERVVVGVSNKTNFVRPVRSGTLHAHAIAISTEKAHQSWEVSITDDQERTVATGMVTLLQLDRVPAEPAPHQAQAGQ